jgi:toxin ParE1/3/4
MTTYGARQHGLRRAMHYYDEIIAVFGILSSNPQLGPERAQGSTRIRLMRHGSHHILYEVDGDDVVILRVVHGSVDWAALFAGDND